MARSATIAEVYNAYIATQDEGSDTTAFNMFEDRLRRESAARHMRRMRSDATRSPSARHNDIQRHQARRAKRFLA